MYSGVFCVLGSGVWSVASYSVPPTLPPLSAGAGLGNQAALLRHKTRFLSFWAEFGVVPAGFFRPADPPRSVPGRGLGNRAAKLWHKAVGFGVRFIFVLPIPPTLGAGGNLGIFATPAVAQDCLTFFSPFRWYNFASPPPRYGCGATLVFVFLRHVFAPAPLSGAMAVVFLDVFPAPYG